LIVKYAKKKELLSFSSCSQKLKRWTPKLRSLSLVTLFLYSLTFT